MLKIFMTTGLLALSLQFACDKEKEKEATGQADVVVIPTVASSSSLTNSFDAGFEVRVTPTLDDMEISSARLHYTLDDSVPTEDSDAVDLAFSSPDEAGTYKAQSNSLVNVSSDLTIHYKAVVTLTQVIDGESKTIVQESSPEKVTYVFQTSTPGPENSNPASKIGLAFASATPAAETCNELIATAFDANGQAVAADKDLTFTLSSATGGYFSSNSSCSMAITSTSIAKGSTTKKIYYRNNDIEAITLVATLNGLEGSALNVTLDRPYPDTITILPSGSGNCRAIVIYMARNSSTFVESTTATTTITLTQTQPSTARSFYTASDCSGSSISNGLVTTVSVPANNSGTTIYLQTNGNGGSYSYNASWSCEARSGTGFSDTFSIF